MPAGRPAHNSEFTTEKVDVFAAVLSETGQVSKACASVGISRVTAYNWRREHAEFALSWENALKIAVSALEDEARRRAQEGFTEPVYHGGEMVGEVRKYSDTLTIFLLKAADPNKYRERYAVTGEDGGPVQIEIRKMFAPVSERDGD